MSNLPIVRSAWRKAAVLLAPLALLALLLAGKEGGAPRAAASPVQQAVYVSPVGDDANPGTEALPFRTPERARDAVRAWNGDMTGDIVVYLRGGTYELADVFRLNAADSGTNGYEVVYRAYPGETPVLSGGRRVIGWSPAQEAAVAGLWEADAADVDYTRQLYVNGVKAVRARGTPPGSLAYENRIDTLAWRNNLPIYEGLTTPDTAIRSWDRIRDVELHVKAWFLHHILPLESVTAAPGGTSLRFREPSFRDAQIKFLSRFLSEEPKAYHIENALELLDEPGEWYMNRATGKVYYMPRPGEEITTAVVTMPKLERLVEVRGTLDEPAGHIRFEGIRFADTTWLRPVDDGYVEAQGGLMMDPNEEMLIHSSFVKPPAAVVLDAVYGVTFERNMFERFGAAAVDIRNGASANRIVGNEFRDLAGAAVQIGGFTHLDAHPADSRAIVKDNVVSNNHIHGVGREFKGSAGIIAGYTEGTRIAHNLIYDLPYSAISVGWGWGYWDEGGKGGAPDYYPTYDTPTVARDNVIEANRIFNVMRELSDGGAIYTLSMMPGTRIAGNYIHDSIGEYGGIYLDQGSGGIEVTGNVVHDVVQPYFYNWRAAGYGDRQATNSVHNNAFGVRPDEPGFPVSTAAEAGPEPAYREGLPEGLVYAVDAPAFLTRGDAVTIRGYRFGGEPGSVVFRGESGEAAVGPGDERLLSWSDESIRVAVPDETVSGSVYIRTAAGASGPTDRRLQLTKGDYSQRLFADDWSQYPLGAPPSDLYTVRSTMTADSVEVTDTGDPVFGRSVKLTATNGSTKLYHLGNWPEQVTATVDFRLNDELAAGQALILSPYFRDGVNGYYLFIEPAEASALSVRKQVNSIEFQRLGSAPKTIEPDIWYTVKMAVLEKRMYVKLWPSGQDEPDRWDLIAADVDGLTMKGGGGLYAELKTNGSPEPKSVLLDRLSVRGWEEVPVSRTVSAWNDPFDSYTPGALSTVHYSIYSTGPDGAADVTDIDGVTSGTHALRIEATNGITGARKANAWGEDAKFRLDFRLPDAGTSGGPGGELLLSPYYADADHYYMLRLSAGDADNVSLVKRADGAPPETIAVVNKPIQAGVWYSVDMLALGADGRSYRPLRVKLWPHGQAEPDAWDLSAELKDATGEGDFYIGLDGGEDGQTRSVLIDSLAVTTWERKAELEAAAAIAASLLEAAVVGDQNGMVAQREWDELNDALQAALDVIGDPLANALDIRREETALREALDVFRNREHRTWLADRFDTYPAGAFPANAKWSVSGAGVDIIGSKYTSPPASLRMTSNASTRALQSKTSWRGDTETSFDFYFGSSFAAPVANDGLYVSPLFVHASNQLRLQIRRNFGTQLVLRQTVGGVESVLAETAKPLQLATWHSAKMRIVGGAVYVKVWEQGTAEPAEWDLQAQSAYEAPPGPGYFRVEWKTYEAYDRSIALDNIEVHAVRTED